MFDLLLEGATIVDGSGAAPHRADLAISLGRIAEIGQLAGAQAAERVRCEGLVLAPGFIDSHNHSDGWLLVEPYFAPKLSQGFTTEVLMSDGISYAPCEPETAADWIAYLRPLNGLTQADYRGWRSWADYMRRFDNGACQHVAGLVPWANFRVLACGWSRAPADDTQVGRMRWELSQALEAGAVGVSTGLDYIAQCFAQTDELVRSLEPLSRYRRPYVTHVRYKEGTLRGILEAIEIGRRLDVPVHISHLKATRAADVEQLLGTIDRAVDSGIDVTFDIYPYLAGSSMLGAVLPYSFWEDGPLACAERLSKPGAALAIERHMEAFGLDPARISIAWVANKRNSQFEGMSLVDVADGVGHSIGETICHLLIEEQLAVLCVFHEGDDRLVEPFLLHPRAMLGTDGIWTPDGPVHPRVYGSAPRLLGDWVRNRGLLSLEGAVRKLTAMPAERFGLAGRGVLCPGAAADLVLFDPEQIADRATYDDPRQVSLGVDRVYVEGQLVYHHRQSPDVTDRKPPGRWLRFGEYD